MRGARALVVASALTAVSAAQFPQQPQPGTGLIVGQVVDAATSKPLGGAIVTLGGVPTVPSPGVLTGSEGRFLFRDLPRGAFTVTAAKSGYVEGAYGRRRPGGPLQQVRLGEGEAADDLVVRMWKFAAISGTVVDEAGEPLVGVRVSAYRRAIIAGNGRFGPRTVTLTDDRGMYRFGNLVPGEYVVGMLARQSGVPMSQARRLGPPNQPSGPGVMQVGDTAYMLGRGVPIPPPPSDGRMLVYPPTFYPSTSGPPTVVTVGSGEERTAIDLQLHPVPSARVSGMASGPGGAAGDVDLMLFPAEFTELPFEEGGSTTLTDGTGAFSFPAVPAGQYSIRALPVGRSREMLWAEVPVTVGRTNVDGVVVMLQPGLHISGRVEFEGSGERPNAQRLQQLPIVIEPAAVPSVILPPGPARVDATGAFTTPGLPPSRYFVRIRDSPVGWMFKSAAYNGRNVADVPLELQGSDATNVVITFTDRWTGFHGTVQSADGLRNDEAIVLLFPADPQAWSGYGLNPRRLKGARTTRTGEYSFTSVPAGDYYMVALPDEQATDWQDPQFLETLASVATQVTIADGEHKAQNLRMRGVR